MRLLIVEDERGMAEGLRGLLEHQGYAVDLAADGEAGLDCALTGLYDLLILDIMLPELDGLEVLTQLRRAGIETPVLMLTARSSVEDRIPGAGPRRGRLPDQALRHRGTAGPGPGADPAEGHAAGRGPVLRGHPAGSPAAGAVPGRGTDPAGPQGISGNGVPFGA